MCSIGEDDFGDEGGAHAMKVDNLDAQGDLLNGICKKCNKNEIVVKMDFKEPECKDCFLENVRHKFRATLGSSKILPREAEVLVVLDGSPESIVLLDMIYFAVTRNNYKRLRCIPQVLYVDEEFLCDSQDFTLKMIKEIISNYNLKTYSVSLASNCNPVDLKDYRALVESEQSFKTHLSSIKTQTSQQDFILKVRYSRIKRSAEQLGIKFVLLPDITPSLATTLLNDVILGRGGSSALDVSFLDDRNENLKIIRPIKDLTTKEVAAYVRLTSLKFPGRHIFGDENGSHASLQNLTKAFIENLQNNFPSTVSTVFRTGDKLALKVVSPNNEDLNGTVKDSMDSLTIHEDKCVFCYSKLDYFNSKTLFATEFSRLVSNTSLEQLKDLQNLEESTKAQLEGVKNCAFKGLCHGCRNIYTEYPNFLNDR